MTISDALHRLLLDNLTTATILLNDDLRLEYMNPAAEMLLAISGQRSHGQFISELFTESAEALSSLRQAVEQAHPFTKREAMLTALTGQTLTVDYAVTPILSNGSDPAAARSPPARPPAAHHQGRSAVVQAGNQQDAGARPGPRDQEPVGRHPWRGAVAGPRAAGRAPQGLHQRHHRRGRPPA